MPNWGLHVEVSQKLMKRLGVKNPFDFVIGSILPDAPWLNIAQAVNLRGLLHCHERTAGNAFYSPNIEEWLNSHRDAPLSSDLYKGIVSHLILDNEINFFWNSICQKTSKGWKILGSGKCINADPAPIKWKETRVYSSVSGDPMGLYLDYTNGELSPQAVNELSTAFGLTAGDIIKMPNNILSGIAEEEESAIDYTWYIPIDQYEAIIDIVSTKCRCLYKVMSEE